MILPVLAPGGNLVVAGGGGTVCRHRRRTGPFPRSVSGEPAYSLLGRLNVIVPLVSAWRKHPAMRCASSSLASARKVVPYPEAGAIERARLRVSDRARFRCCWLRLVAESARCATRLVADRVAGPDRVRVLNSPLAARRPISDYYEEPGAGGCNSFADRAVGSDEFPELSDLLGVGEDVVDR